MKPLPNLEAIKKGQDNVVLLTFEHGQSVQGIPRLWVFRSANELYVRRGSRWNKPDGKT